MNITFKIAITGAFLLLFLFSGEAIAQKKKKKKKQEKQTEEITEKDLIETNYYFSEGMRYGLKEEYDKAAKYYEKALSLMPENAAIHFKLGETYSKLDELDKALEYSKSAVELDPNNEYYYILLARVYEYSGDFGNAILTYKELIANVEGTESSYYDLAILQVMSNDWDGALKSYEAILNFYGPNPEVSAQKQKIYLKLNKLDEAISEGRRLIKDFPEDPQYVINLAILYKSNGKTEEAILLLDSALIRDPELSAARLVLYEIYRDEGKNADAFEQLKLAFSDANLNLAQKAGLLSSFERFAKTDQEKEQAIELGLILIKTHPRSDVVYSLMGDFYLQREDKIEALEYYKQSVEINPSSFSVWMNILILNFEEGRNDSLVFYSEQMIEIFPNNARVWFLQGLGYYALNDYENAKFSLENARKWAANEEDLLGDIEATLGDCYYNLGEHENSDKSYDWVLARDPDNDHVLNNYSYFLSLRNENLDKALEMSTRLVEKHPENSTYLDTHAWVLFQMERYEEALPFLSKASENSDSGVIHEHYGDVLFKLGREEEAIEAWKKAKEIGGAGESLDKKLENGKWYE